MERIAFLRQYSSTDHALVSHPQPQIFDTLSHGYPFDTLPLLKSHLHPKFAIVDAGRKLSSSSDLLRKLIQILPALEPSITLLLAVYHMWTSEQKGGPSTHNSRPTDDDSSGPKDNFSGPKDDPSESKDDDRNRPKDDNKPVTRSSMLMRSAVAHKPSQLGPKRKLLTRVTLSTHDQLLGEDACWTDDRIRGWNDDHISSGWNDDDHIHEWNNDDIHEWNDDCIEDDADEGDADESDSIQAVTATVCNS